MRLRGSIFVQLSARMAAINSYLPSPDGLMTTASASRSNSSPIDSACAQPREFRFSCLAQSAKSMTDGSA